MKSLKAVSVVDAMLTFFEKDTKEALIDAHKFTTIFANASARAQVKSIEPLESRFKNYNNSWSTAMDKLGWESQSNEEVNFAPGSTTNTTLFKEIKKYLPHDLNDALSYLELLSKKSKAETDERNDENISMYNLLDFWWEKSTATKGWLAFSISIFSDINNRKLATTIYYINLDDIICCKPSLLHQKTSFNSTSWNSIFSEVVKSSIKLKVFSYSGTLNFNQYESEHLMLEQRLFGKIDSHFKIYFF